jgi:hypothetical protein
MDIFTVHNANDFFLFFALGLIMLHETKEGRYLIFAVLPLQLKHAADVVK